ncbi:hypothetical protein Pmani_029058 [Petrolisthes manimaculis]|uniref:Uncharacterized protein n=1 Tax=Petrolisthes manimaculis TaxID=1843537 RepID=A0AAE1TUU6_9EUCA|nr:hypothetical protein Pmani_029058 [Petrolisthes manimaculis]
MMLIHPGVEFSPADPPRVVVIHSSRGGIERCESKLVREKGFGGLMASMEFLVVSGNSSMAARVVEGWELELLGDSK